MDPDQFLDAAEWVGDRCRPRPPESRWARWVRRVVAVLMALLEVIMGV